MLQLDEDTLTIEGLTPCCEHPDHAHRPVHADGQEHYVRAFFPCGCVGTELRVFCLQWLTYLHTRGTVGCVRCNVDYPLTEAMQDLGPVSSFHG